MPGKRRRVSSSFRAPRPIDKTILSIFKNVTTTQQNVTLITAVFPCTITGLRWDLNTSLAVDVGDNTGTSCTWVIYLLKENVAVPAMNLSDGQTLIRPEEDCLVFGAFHAQKETASSFVNAQVNRGSTKTMRKLAVGDRLVWSALSDSAQGTVITGAIQFFCKT